MSSPNPVATRSGRVRAGGFTVLELLVAATLFIILLTLLLGVMSNTTSIASRATEQIETTRIARECLDLIGRDISSAALPWSRTNTNSLQFLVNSSNYFNSMFWQAPVVRDSTNARGNLAIVGYFVLRDFQATNTRTSRLQLRRVFIDPKSTNGDYTIYGTNTPWITDTTYSDYGPATAAADNLNAQKGWVADGVLGMWVRCLDKTGGVLTNTSYDSRQSFRVANKQWYPTNYSALPAFVEVGLVCVAPREVVQLRDLSVGNTMTNLTNFQAGVSSYADQIRAKNPGAKSVTAFIRKFRLYNSD